METETPCCYWLLRVLCSFLPSYTFQPKFALALFFQQASAFELKLECTECSQMIDFPLILHEKTKKLRNYAITETLLLGGRSAHCYCVLLGRGWRACRGLAAGRASLPRAGAGCDARNRYVSNAVRVSLVQKLYNLVTCLSWMVNGEWRFMMLFVICVVTRSVFLTQFLNHLCRMNPVQLLQTLLSSMKNRSSYAENRNGTFVVRHVWTYIPTALSFQSTASANTVLAGM